MRRELEDELRNRIATKQAGASVREVIAAMVSEGRIQSEKQAWRTLEKWSQRGEYDYGVSLDLGWLT